MHIVSTNFTKMLVWKYECDVKLWRHKQRTPNTNDHHMPLKEPQMKIFCVRHWYEGHRFGLPGSLAESCVAQLVSFICIATTNDRTKLAIWSRRLASKNAANFPCSNDSVTSKYCWQDRLTTRSCEPFKWTVVVLTKITDVDAFRGVQ